MSVTGSEAAAAGDSGPRRAEQQLPSKKRRVLPLRSGSKKRSGKVDDSIEEHQPASSLPSNELFEDQSQRIQPHIATSEAAASSSAAPDVNTASPVHVSSHTDRFGTFFSSPWNTDFLLTVAPHQPWRGGEVYVEVPNEGAQCVASTTSSIPIDPPSGHCLMRIDGPKPLWFHSKPVKAEIVGQGPSSPASPSPSSCAAPPSLPAASTSAPTGVTDMPPPPEETYASGELAVASAQQFALEHGYKLAIVRSSANDGLRRWDLRCHQSRPTSARGQSDEDQDVEGVEDDAIQDEEGQEAQPQVGCKFAVAIRPVKGRWQLKVTHATHHGHDKNVNTLANEAKKLTPDEKLLIARLYGQDSNIKRARIFETLNKRRKEQSKVLLSDPVLVSRQLRQLRNLRKEGTGRQATPASAATSERPQSSSPFPSATTTSSSSSAALPLPLEAHAAQDFQQSLFQQLGCSLPRLPEDHESRITAAAQLYLSSTSLVQSRRRRKRNVSSNSSSAEHESSRDAATRLLAGLPGHDGMVCVGGEGKAPQLDDVDEEELAA